MLKNTALLLLFLIFIGCDKDDADTPISNIKYQIQLPDTFNLSIQYYSDKYFDTGNLESFTINNNSYTPPKEGFWEGKRIQSDKSKGYFIQVNVNNTNEFDGVLKVIVFVNDTIAIDSTSYSFGTTEINLQGSIPKTF